MKLVTTAIGFVNFTIDSPLSEEGNQQIAFVSELLRNDDFIGRYNPQLHVHSPLQRARDTHAGLFPESLRAELECLREITPTEYLFSPSRRALQRRIAEFESWLEERDETSIVAVGHSQYFRLMLDSDHVMENCSVLHCTFHPHLQGRERWVVHDTLYSTKK